jgi:hypothetical protein
MSAMSSSHFSRFLYLRETVAREGGKFPFLLELFDFGSVAVGSRSAPVSLGNFCRSGY